MSELIENIGIVSQAPLAICLLVYIYLNNKSNSEFYKKALDNQKDMFDKLLNLYKDGKPVH